MPDNIAERDITIVLTGSEWLAVLAKLTGRPLSDEGRVHYRSAGEKMTAQIKAEREKVK